MKRISIAVVFGLLALNVSTSSRAQSELANSQSGTLSGKIFRSDTNVAIDNSYILLMQGKEDSADAKHFDVRTVADGKYRFSGLPAGKYTVSIRSWYRDRTDVPCANSADGKTADEGHVTVEWQGKSDCFMEIVTIKGFSIESARDTVRDFDVACR